MSSDFTDKLLAIIKMEHGARQFSRVSKSQDSLDDILYEAAQAITREFNTVMCSPKHLQKMKKSLGNTDCSAHALLDKLLQGVNFEDRNN